MKKLGTIELSNNILEKANIGLWAFELDEGSEPRMYVDKTMMKLIGLEKEVSPEETYHAWYDNIDKDHYGEVAESVEKMTSGIHAEVQYPWHHPNGEIWIVRCGGVRNYAYKKGIRIEGTHQNVSALMHYEKRNLTDLLALLAGNFLQVLFIDPYSGSFNIYGRYLLGEVKSIDSSSVNFYEYATKACELSLHKDDIEYAKDKFSKENLIHALESNLRQEFTVKYLLNDNKAYIYMTIRMVPFEDNEGLKKIVLGIINSTSEKEAERTIKERNSYLEHFLSGFQSAYIVDLDNNSFEIIHMDQEFQKIFMKEGGKPEMNSFIEKHIHPDDRELMRKMSNSANVKEILSKQNEISFTAREIFDGIEKTLRVLIMRGVDNVRVAVGFMDITDQIAKEKEYSHKLEAANAAKSTFLFNMSHDIRTPMNAILGYEVLARKRSNDEVVNDYLNKIDIAGNQLLSLVNQVLEMSRIESGKISLQEQKIDMEKGAEVVRTIYENQANAKGINFIVEVKNITHIHALGDNDKISQITNNLIGNALKYTPENGLIKSYVQEEPCEIPGYAYYRMTVEDNGIGMDEKYLPHIFEEFSREQTSTISHIQGTGLGLSIVKRLVTLMNGTIEVESKLGEGSKFIVCLPLKIDNNFEEEENKEEVLKNNSIEGMNILLVEDNEMNREIAVEILSETGAKIDTAQNGKEAYEKVQNSPIGKYDLILMDIQMPIMNGYEATRLIRQLPEKEKANIPIIAMTANAFEEDKKEALNAGMNSHLSKPIDVYKLIATIAKFSK